VRVKKEGKKRSSFDCASHVPSRLFIQNLWGYFLCIRTVLWY